MPNYISENQSPSEVFRQFGDQVPEFMRSWLEDLVNKVSLYKTYEAEYEDEITSLKSEILDLEESLEESLEDRDAALLANAKEN